MDPNRPTDHHASPETRLLGRAPSNRVTRAQDRIVGGLGIWLMLSPFVLGFADQDAPRWTTVAFGALALILTIEDMLFPSEIEEWVSAAAGFGLLTAPWTVGFDEPAAAVANCVFVGAVLFGISAWAIARLHDKRRAGYTTGPE